MNLAHLTLIPGFIFYYIFLYNVFLVSIIKNKEVPTKLTTIKSDEETQNIFNIFKKSIDSRHLFLKNKHNNYEAEKFIEFNSND